LHHVIAKTKAARQLAMRILKEVAELNGIQFQNEITVNLFYVKVERLGLAKVEETLFIVSDIIDELMFIQERVLPRLSVSTC
jgi:hypothetical protein